MKKCATKKMANGGRVMGSPDKMMPAKSNKGGAMRGKARAAAMSGRTFANGGQATIQPYPMPTPSARAMPEQSNAGGAMRGQARAAAMSGRAFANGGKVFKSKVVKSTRGK